MVAPLDKSTEPASGTDGIVLEAFDRWKVCREWQGVEDERSRDDIKFANGDSRNAWQWPDRLYQQRTGAGQDLPCLTINSTRVHNDMIINSMAKNPYGIKVRPVAGKASYKSAEMMETLIRRTENISKASSHYRKVDEQAVDGGIGYIILRTDWVSERSFDQDVYIHASRDPTAVYLDPWIKEPDGSDANFGFEFERMPRKEFNRKYPKWANRVGSTPLDSFFTDWLTDKEIMLAKYYRKEERRDTLIAYTTDAGEEAEKLKSELRDEVGKDLSNQLIEDIENGVIEGRIRPVTDNKVEWFLIAGNKVVDKGKWAGKYIPICRQVGRELVIDGTLDRKGHTRPLIDAQRMLNYAASTDVQVTALQPKSPWVGAARATEGQEGWKTGNIDAFGVLLYNDYDEDAPPGQQTIPAPQRIDPPRGNAAFQMAMQNAERQMNMISGQSQAQMGESDSANPASGKAIGERQEQGDTATYHFVEHKADMLRFLGVQLMDLYPKIYDTERALHVTGKDGEKYWLKINPNQDDAIQELKDEQSDEEAVRLSFNPRLGEYECVSDPGPSYATQRQEGWDAGVMILTQSKELTGVVGDLVFKNGDFQGADKIAERLQKEIKATKPYLFDDKVDPQVTALQQQIQHLTALNVELVQKLSLKEIALRGKDEKRDIDASHAETDRLKVMVEFLTKTMLSPKDQATMQHEIEGKFHDASLQMIVDANQAELQPQEPMTNGAAS